MSVVEAQWRNAEADSPLIVEAYLQSLIALSDYDPLTAYQARDRALKLVREAGLIAPQHQTCAPCPIPKTDQDYARYRNCLAWRVQCLGSRRRHRCPRDVGALARRS